jgi:predicted dehydrogenase
VRLGILSTANINRRVIPGAKESPEVELVAVASRSQDAADAYAREWAIPTAHGSYEALLEDPNVDALYISLPNGLHVEWSVRALEAGKHVLCEKPLDRRPEEVERAFDAADRAGRILMEAFMYRHHPQMARVRELVAEGAIGALRLIRSTFSYALYDDDNIRLRPEMQGGSLMDVGCYCVHAARQIAGEPEEVFGRQYVGPSGTDWVFNGSLRHGDVLSTFDSGTALPERAGLEVLGEEGGLFLADPFHCANPGIVLCRGESVETIEVERLNPWQLELENLSKAIRGDAEPLLGRDDAVAQARAVDALYRSAEADSPVTLAADR